MNYLSSSLSLSSFVPISLTRTIVWGRYGDGRSGVGFGEFWRWCRVGWDVMVVVCRAVQVQTEVLDEDAT